MARTATVKKLPTKIKDKKKIDYPMLIIILILLTFGLVMMFSASYANAYFYKGDSTHYIARQIIIAGIGLIFMFGIMFVPYTVYKKSAIVIYIGSLILNALPVLGFYSWGEFKRWLVIPGTSLTVQPSEFAKFAIIMLFSERLTKKTPEELKGFKTGIFDFVKFLIPVMILTILQNHLSGTLIIAALAGILLIIGGIPFRYIVPLVPIGILGIFFIYKSHLMPHINARIDLWRNPFLDPGDDGYQSIQSLFAIASGGVLGRGLGNSRQKFSYLPEPQNDFIFSIIAEELGFMGSLVVIILFVAFVVRGIQISLRIKDLFAKYVTVGIVMQVGLQALLNIAVVTNTIPNTGISLPFFSQGGTALLILLMEMGVLLNISREAEIEQT